MIVLSRRVGQKIVINGNIVVRVLQYENGKIKLGVEAPREIIVDREEIHERRKREEAA